MPKKPLTPKLVDRITTCYHKWEFLRRNPEYQKDYQTYQREHGKHHTQFVAAIGKTHKTNSDRLIIDRYFHGPFIADWDLSEKWCIAFLADPNAHVPLKDLLAKPFLIQDNPFSRLYTPAVFSGVQEAHAKDPTVLQLTINLRRPKRQVLEETQALIEQRLEKLMETEGYRVVTRKRRFACYNDYLRTWDLRQAGKTYPEIARRLYPGKFKDAAHRRHQTDLGQRAEYASLVGQRNPVVQRCIDNFNRAKHFVWGGYTEMT